ncbi:MAG: hypothetical protein PVG43_02940 [Nitrosopumilaceae archaeon]|jgi:hypothetical protein
MTKNNIIPTITLFSILMVGAMGFSQAYADSLTISDQTTCEEFGGTWVVPDNCQTGVFVLDEDMLTIDSGITLDLTSSLSLIVNSTITNNGSIENGGLFTADSASITNNGDFTLSILGNVNFTNSESGIYLLKDGTDFISSGSTVINQGLINVTSIGGPNAFSQGSSGFLNNTGTFVIDSINHIFPPLFNNGTIMNFDRITVTQLENYGLINNTSGALMENDGTVNNESGGTIISKHVYQQDFGTTLNNKQGAIFDSDGNFAATTGSVINNDGIIEISGISGSNHIMNNNGTITNDGTYHVSGTINIQNAGILDNDGTLIVSGKINNQGTFDNSNTVDNTIGRIIDRCGTFIGTIPTSGNPVEDECPPETTIDSVTDGEGNNLLIQDPPRTASLSVTFGFSGSDARSVVGYFECNLNSNGWNPCASPQSYDPVIYGPNTIEIRATDNAGNIDDTPAIFSWSVLTIEEVIEQLMETIDDESLGKNVENSLLGPLKKVSKILGDSNPDNDDAACDKLDEFIENINDKESSGKLDTENADLFESEALWLKDNIGCS